MDSTSRMWTSALLHRSPTHRSIATVISTTTRWYRDRRDTTGSSTPEQAGGLSQAAHIASLRHCTGVHMIGQTSPLDYSWNFKAAKREQTRVFFFFDNHNT